MLRDFLPVRVGSDKFVGSPFFQGFVLVLRFLVLVLCSYHAGRSAPGETVWRGVRAGAFTWGLHLHYAVYI